MAWADNIFTFSTSPHGALVRMEAVESFLEDRWGLSVKATSKEVLLAPRQALETARPGWDTKPYMKALGHTVQANGATSMCQEHTVKAAWGAYWKQFESLAKTLVTSHRIRHMARCIDPVMRFRCPRWLWSKTAAAKLRAQQRRMVLPLLAVKKSKHETWDNFAKRREWAYKSCGAQPWDQQWSNAILAWHRHLDRHTLYTAAEIRHLTAVQQEVNFHRRTVMSLTGVGTRKIKGQPMRTTDSVERGAARSRTRKTRQRTTCTWSGHDGSVRCSLAFCTSPFAAEKRPAAEFQSQTRQA
jgi:hypothetical protein